jgi:hypothetical protein
MAEVAVRETAMSETSRLGNAALSSSAPEGTTTHIRVTDVATWEAAKGWSPEERPRHIS